MRFVARVTVVCLMAMLAVQLSATRAAAQNWDEVEILVEDAAPGVYMLIGRGGNIGVSAGEDGIFLIDDQYAPLTDTIVATLKRLRPGPIRFVINTHWHGDHTGGNENLGEAGAILVAHLNTRKRLSTDQVLEMFGGREYPALPEQALPVVTFTRDVTFHLNGDELYVFHAPNAHTDGDAIIHFRDSNVVHMGDTYFNGIYPRIDVEQGGSIDGIIDAAEKVLELADDDTAIMPGHGPMSNREELASYRRMLLGVRERVLAEIRAGKTLDDVVAARPTSEYDGEWGGGFINPETFTRILYADLSEEP